MRLPSIPSIQNKHWRSMVSQNPYLAEVYPEPPLTAYKIQRNIRDSIVRARVPPPLSQYPRRQINGMKKCERGCIICPFVKEAKHVKGNTFTWSINNQVNCHTTQFQIEGGGVVQGVTKLISTFSTFVT